MAWAELYDILMGLSLPKLEDLFGSAPSQPALAALDFEELRPVVRSIQRTDPGRDPPLTAPSPGKLAANDLSNGAVELLR